MPEGILACVGVDLCAGVLGNPVCCGLRHGMWMAALWRAFFAGVPAVFGVPHTEARVVGVVCWDGLGYSSLSFWKFLPQWEANLVSAPAAPSE